MKYNGFTLIEVLLAISISSFSLLLITSLLSIIVNFDYQNPQTLIETSIHQMRLLFVLGKDWHLEGDMLAFRYLQDDVYFNFYEDKLVLNEGYQVFLMHIEDVYFTNEKQCYYLYYSQDGDTYEKRIIGCEK